MIVQSVHFTFALEDADRVEGIFRELREASRKESGVLGFDVARGQRDPSVFVLWEVYRDEEALEAHKETEHYKRLAIEGVRPLARNRAGEIATPI
jgi:(4S)-4-hydroxy-5-phosphonooxypentane-2,3-dione isomerase